MPEAEISLPATGKNSTTPAAPPIADDPDTWTRQRPARFSGLLARGKTWPDHRLHEE